MVIKLLTDEVLPGIWRVQRIVDDDDDPIKETRVQGLGSS